MPAHPFDPHALFADRIITMRPSLVRELLKNASGPGFISFAGGLPNPKFFPAEALIGATEAVLRSDAGNVLQYAVTEGYPGLREWIAARIKHHHGLIIPIEDILITSGSQQGLDLLGKVLINKGDVIVNEKPGYQGAIHALSMYQPRFMGVTLNSDGLDVPQLQGTLAAHSPKFVIVTPNYQNPTGITYTTANRRAIADVIRDHNTVLVEDDPYAELGFGSSHQPTLRVFLEGQTVMLGSFSKLASPGMRLGWLIAPRDIHAKVIIAKQATDFHSSNFAQRVLHHYLTTSAIDEHVALIQAGYARQCRAMLSALERYLPPGIPFTRPEGGMFVWLTLPPEANSLAILQDAIADKVSFMPGVPFFTDGGGQRYMRLSYSQMDETTIDDGMRRLAQVIVKHLDGPAPLPVQVSVPASAPTR